MTHKGSITNSKPQDLNKCIYEGWQGVQHACQLSLSTVSRIHAWRDCKLHCLGYTEPDLVIKDMCTLVRDCVLSCGCFCADTDC